MVSATTKSFFMLGLLCAMVLLVAGTANAQAQNTANDAAAQILNPTNVTGLTSCADIGANFIGECGDVIQQARLSQYPFTFRYQVGNTVKCSITRVLATDVFPRCVVSQDGTIISTYNESFLGNSAEQTNYDAEGNQTSTQAVGFQERTAAAVANGLSGVGEAVVDAVGGAILLIATLFLGLAGVFFNLVVVKAVFQFATLIGNSPGLLLAWGILRDVANMALLFGFIFLGLKTVLQVDSVPAQKAIPRLLIFAVLMNFSLFATQAVIDVSNVLASTMYTQANSDPCAVQGTAQQSTGNFSESQADLEACAVNIGLAGSLMNASGLSTLFKVNDDTDLSLSIATYIGLALFATIGAVVFIAGGIMLVVRAIKLTFLMVASPLLFAALAIPQFQKQGEKYWNELISNAFFAPVFLLLILVSLKITEGIGGVTNGGMAAALTTPNASVMGVFLIFAIVIGFMLASLVAAQKFGAYGADYALKTAKSIANSPRVAAVGGARWAGRQTVGRAAYGIGSGAQKRYERWMGKEPSSFAGKAARSVLRNNVLGIDSGIKSATGSAQGIKFGDKSFKEKQDARKKRQEDFRKAATEAEREKKEKGRKAKLEELLKDEQSSDGDISNALRQMSTKELAGLDAVVDAPNERLARNLSPEQFENLLKSTDLTDAQKSALRDARLKALAEDVEGGNVGKVRKWSIKDLEQLAESEQFGSLLTDERLVNNLSDDQFDGLRKSPKLNSVLKSQLQEIRKKRFDTSTEEAAERTKERIGGMTSEQIANLDSDTLKRREIHQHLDVDNFEKIRQKGNLSRDARSTIGTYLQEVAAGTDPRSASFLAYLNSDPRVGQFWGI